MNQKEKLTEDLKVLWVLPGREFKWLDAFLKESEVRIGYGLNTDDYRLLSSDDRKELLQLLEASKNKEINGSAAKGNASKVNRFFDPEVKYCIFPDRSRKHLYVGKLSREVNFKEESDGPFHSRSFELIDKIQYPTGKPFPRPGVLLRRASEFPGLEDLINDHGMTTPVSAWDEFYDSELIGYEGKVRVELELHERIERDLQFVKDFKEKYKDIRSCQACFNDAGPQYGLEPGELLELHHITPLAKSKASYSHVVGEKDVMLLCPNCHRAIHRLMAINRLERISLEEFAPLIEMPF